MERRWDSIVRCNEIINKSNTKNEEIFGMEEEGGRIGAKTWVGMILKSGRIVGAKIIKEI